MRSDKDLLRIRVTAYSLVDLDLERVESDPRWEQIALRYDLNDPESKTQALFEYLGSYVSQELLFDSNFMPSTNGPAGLFITDMEDVTHGNHKGSTIA